MRVIREDRKTHRSEKFLALATPQYYCQLEMWANAQRDGRPAEYRWRPVFNATQFFYLTPTTRVACSNAAKMRNLLKFAGVPQTRQQISTEVHHIVRTCGGDIAV